MRLPKIPSRHVSLLATTVVCLVLYLVDAVVYTGFASASVFVNLLADNAFLGIAAIGMTFVIISGGIDLSVGSMVGFTSILVATLIGQYHVHPVVAAVTVLALGALFGAGMGALIRWFELPPFLVTLAGMFLARGLALVISQESVPIENPLCSAASTVRVAVAPGVQLPLPAVVFLAFFVIALYVAQLTRFGRNTYALGGSSTSAMLMGLPCGRTTVLVYTFSGFCSTLAGLIFSLYTLSGNATAGVGLELDAIAASVIGGTLLSGGVGHVAGTLMGVLILGIIQTAITFQGTLSSWWTRIAIGVLLLAFILLQRLIQSRAAARG